MVPTAAQHLEYIEGLIVDAHKAEDLQDVRRLALLVEMHLGAGKLAVEIAMIDRTRQAQLDMKSMMSSLSEATSQLLPGGPDGLL